MNASDIKADQPRLEPPLEGEHLRPYLEHLQSLAAVTGSVAVALDEREKLALDKLCSQKDMTPQGVMLAALRLYQAAAVGAAEIEWKPTGLPVGCMGENCPPNAIGMAAGAAVPPLKSD